MDLIAAHPYFAWRQELAQEEAKKDPAKAWRNITSILEIDNLGAHNWTLRHVQLRDNLKILRREGISSLQVFEWYLEQVEEYLQCSVASHFEERQTEIEYDEEKSATNFFPEDVNDIHTLFTKLEQPLESIKPGGILQDTDYHEQYRQTFKRKLKESLPKDFESTGLKYFQEVFEQVEEIEPYLKPVDNFLLNFSITSLPYRGSLLRRILSTTLEDEMTQPFMDTFYPKAEALVSVCKKLSKLNEDNMEGLAYSTPKESTDNVTDMSSEFYATCEDTLQKFRNVCAQLRDMDLELDWLQVCRKAIEKKLESEDWAECWDDHILAKGLSWMRDFFLPLVSCIENHAVDANVKDPSWLKYLRHKIMLDCIFSIIVDYPTSLPAVEDLKVALEKTSKEDALREKLLSELGSRLLHQGASTSDILHQYLSCIRCLQVWEVGHDTTRCVLGMFVRYLRSYRTDTAVEVIEMITNGDLAPALQSAMDMEDTPEYDMDEDDAADTDSFTRKSAEPPKLSWYSDDANAPYALEDVDFIQKLSSNPIQLLITTCKSKKAFREEYRRFLATNLLATKNYNIDQELMLLEVLKRNFGTQRFHECDVMIKDIDEGKRVDKMIHDKAEDLTANFHGVILSKHYWPEMKDTDAHVKVADDLAIQMDMYGTTYKSIKSSRKLSWLPALAKANVDVELGGQVINVDLSPWGARILSLFERKPMWTKQEICKQEGFDDKRVQLELAELVNLKILRRAKEGLYISADFFG
ncbi:hypothetical protein NQZ79_g4460 [Umbelopsis isabellina]|nr:hypothetical protein NQZ79_g4460 [Umbelopsis isabellina]